MPDITTTSAVDTFMQSADEAAMRAAMAAMHEHGSQGVRPVSASRALATSGASNDMGYTLVISADSVDIEIPYTIGVTGTVLLWVRNDNATLTLAAMEVLRVGEKFYSAGETIPLPKGLHTLSTASPYGWALALGIDPATKVDTAAIVDDLTTGGTSVPLSAEQGKTLKGLVDGLPSVPETMIAMRTATLARDTTTTVADDPQLTLSVESSTRYLMEIMVMFDNVTTVNQGIKVGVSAPSGYDMNARFFGGYNGNAVAGSWGRNFADWGGNPRAVAYGSTSQECLVEIRGYIRTTGTAGDVAVQWAQSTSSANATRVLEGSYIRLTKIS